MRHFLLVLLWLSVPGIVTPSLAYAQLYLLETENLRLIDFGRSHEYLVSHVARCFENALSFHTKLFRYTPSEKVTVLLQDFTDYGNAGAGVIPKNHITLSIAPLSYVYETSPANERMNTTMNHELVHIVAGDRASRVDRFFRRLFFGKIPPSAEHPVSMVYSYLTTPRRYAPRWYQEGIAVFLETWMAGGIGRAQGGYDEMVFRTMVRDTNTIFDLVGLESEGTKIDFQVGANAYLYGTRFMSYLALMHGPERLVQWVSRTDESRRFFASQFEAVYSSSLELAWAEWIAWERQFQRANLASIRAYPLTVTRRLCERPLGSVSRAYYDASAHLVYAAVNYPGQIAHIAAISTVDGTVRRLCDIKGPALYFVSSLAYDSTSGTLFYTTDNNDWRDLCSVDVRTGVSNELLSDVRVGDLVFNAVDRSLWGVRHYEGISTLVRIPSPYTEWNQVYSWEYGKDIFDIDLSPDGGTLIGTLADISGRHRLIRMDVGKLLHGDAAYDTVCELEGSSPANFTFSPDGEHVFGTSYYTGTSNIYRCSLATKELDILSNCETGLFRPLPLGNDSLIAFEYSGQGFVPVVVGTAPVANVNAIRLLGHEVSRMHPVVRTWMLGSPASVRLDSLTTSAGEYHATGDIGIAGAYPIVEGYKDFTGVGALVNLSDPIGLNAIEVKGSYTPARALPAKERTHLSATFGYLQWKLRATYNDASFYDLFGPTKTSRKGYTLGAQYRGTLLYDEPRTAEYTIQLTGYGGLETSPDYQNVRSSFDRMVSASVRFLYKDLRASLGAVDHEKGYSLEAVAASRYVRRTVFPHVYGMAAYGIPLPLDHSSVWLRSSAGYAFGERDEPFANFFLGGFGNNWVDRLPEKRYREVYSFPGVPLDEIGGTNFAKAMLEWTMPPLRFRRLGIPSLYSPWLRCALFTTCIITNIDDRQDQRVLMNAGAQLDIKLIFLSHLYATLSFGYAVAVEREQHLTREFMVSLKIL